MSEKDRWLLPEGIDEILPPEARRLEALRRRLLDLFDLCGYELVMPPLVEYLESLLTGSGRDLDLQTFKLTDQLTGRLMGIRADMTPQAARIDAHYLKREAPVRLCYVGSVLRTRPDEFAGSRELLQLGAELYGHPGPESDIEILRLMLEALAAIGLADPHLDLGHVGVFRGLARDAGLAPAQEADLFEALQRKARPEVEAFLAGCDVAAAKKQALAGLLDLNGAGEVLALACTLLKSAPKDVNQALANLQTVAAVVQRAYPRLPMYFDLAELRGYRYYTGIVFSALIPGQGQAVAQGGRYDGIGKAFGRSRAATGFSADLRQLLKIAPAEDSATGAILAPYGEDPGLQQAITRLRGAGERVVSALPGVSAPAAGMGCDRELVKQGGAWVVEKLGDL
jgi:ATP phosphoribosyltransferase regulatory subunit